MLHDVKIIQWSKLVLHIKEIRGKMSTTEKKIRRDFKMTEYIDLAYPVYDKMPVYPGLPDVEVRPR